MDWDVSLSQFSGYLSQLFVFSSSFPHVFPVVCVQGFALFLMVFFLVSCLVSLPGVSLSVVFRLLGHV